MTATAQLISTLVAGGMDAAEAAGLVARAAVEMTGALTRKSSGAIRQQRYRERNKASLRYATDEDETVTNRNESVTRYAQPETSQTVTKRNESVTSDAASLSKRVLDNSKEEKKRERRASQLPDGWRPDERRWSEACLALGSEDRAERELRKFANHALEKGRVAKNWNAAWDNWVDRAVEWSPKGQPPSGARPTTVHQQRQLESKEALNALRNASSRENFEFQRHHSGAGPASLHSGVRGAIIDLSAARDREGHESVDRIAGDGQLSELGKISGAS